MKIDVVFGHFGKRTQIKIEIFGLLFFLFPFCWSVIHEFMPLFLKAYQKAARCPKTPAA